MSSPLDEESGCRNPANAKSYLFTYNQLRMRLLSTLYQNSYSTTRNRRERGSQKTKVSCHPQVSGCSM